MNRIKSFTLALVAIAVMPVMAQKSIPLVYDQEFTGAGYPAPQFPTVEEAVVSETLTNPFVFSNSNVQLKEFKDWERRRAEIVRELQHYEVGEKPIVDKKDIEAKLEDSTLTVIVHRNGETLTITSKISYPEGDGPFPLMIGTSHNSLPRHFFSERKIATMRFSEGQVNSYSQFGGFGGGGKKKNRGEYEFDRLYPELVDNGAYSMWAWGVSRIIDGLEIVGAASKIDMQHIGVTGCSYAGKMALWSGAFDERIALTIAQEPGGGGAAAWRVSETLGKVEKLGATDEHWFKKSMWEWKDENVSRLPYDHHELCALICPRALLVLGNTDYEWLADEAAYVSCVAAREVWKRFGIEDRMGFSIQGKHGHCQLPESQYPEVEAFIDRFLLGKEEANTIVQFVDETLQDKEVQKWIPWATVDFK